MAEKVTMMAYADLVDPVAGQVKAGEEFETSEQNAKTYRRAQWAGAPGTDPREIQASVAATEYEERQTARQQVSQARQQYRNLAPSSVERQNVGVDSPIGGGIATAVAQGAGGKSAEEAKGQKENEQGEQKDQQKAQQGDQKAQQNQQKSEQKSE